MSGKMTAKGVRLIYRKQEWQMQGDITLRQAMIQAGLDVQNLLGLRGGKLIPDDTLLADGDEITLVAIVSGG
jgi:sulfur carrier protein ThiS